MAQSIKFVVCSLLLLIAACDAGDRLQPLTKNAVILAFGDSLTHGTGASIEQAYPQKLQAMLSRTVINAGVPGEISQTGLKRLPGLLKKYQPELLILCHGGNDILRKKKPETNQRKSAADDRSGKIKPDAGGTDWRPTIRDFPHRSTLL